MRPTGISRKQFLQSPAALALPSLAAQEPDRPNVVILLSDQHRPDLLTSAGNPLVPTPNLDRIATAGVRFTHAYCPYPVCAPSRMSLLTGQYAHTHGVTDNTHAMDWRRRTVAHTFRDHGYLTGLIGKMHFLDGNTHGFDFRLGCNDWLQYLGPKVHHYADEIASYPGYLKLIHDTGCCFPDVDGLSSGPSPWIGNVTRKKTLASDLSAEDQLDAFIAREAGRFIERYRDQPFFLVAGFLKPHAPFYPPKGFADEVYPPDRMVLPPAGDIDQYPKHVRDAAALYRSYGEAQLRMIRAGYLGNLRFLDTCVGTVYRTLERLNLLRNTIVIYSSDHGEMGGDHGLFQKFMFFEPSAGVPLIVSRPGTLPEGKVCRALTPYTGIYPTVCELAGLPAPAGIDVQSFARLIRDPDARGPSAVFAEYALSWSPRYMIRTARYKYNYNEGDLAELYDLEQDPGESVNRAGDPVMQRMRRQLHDELVAWYDPQQNPFRSRKGTNR